MSQVDTELITQAEYARHRGVSRESVRKAVEAGRITVFGPDKRINAELADVQWRRNTRPRLSHAKPAASPTAGAARPVTEAGTKPPLADYGAARARREHYQAELARLELERALGRLFVADDVIDAMRDAAATFRTTVEGWAHTLPPLIVGLDGDEVRIHALLTGECERLLRRISDRFADLVHAGDTPPAARLDLLS